MSVKQLHVEQRQCESGVTATSAASSYLTTLKPQLLWNRPFNANVLTVSGNCIFLLEWPKIYNTYWFTFFFY